MTAQSPTSLAADPSAYPSHATADGGIGRRLGRSLRGRARAASVVGASAMLVAGVVAPAAAAPPNPGAPSSNRAGPWELTGWRSMAAGGADQGVATVSAPGHREHLVLRGGARISPRLRAEGWWHVGDPGSAHGYLLDVYQARSARHAKLFVMTAPGGRRSRWVHRIVRGEKINNSFAAVAPSGRWFVSGEWGKMRRLLIFPMPGRNPLARPGHDLPLVASIKLSRPVRDVQGCSFASAIRLICSTNDPHHDLFRTAQQLLTIALPRPVSGQSEPGRPSELGPVPQLAGCGPAETEGLDVHGGRLLLVAHEADSCGGRVVLYTYHLKALDVSLQPAG